MSNKKQPLPIDDPWHVDGVFCGPQVPMSVFYKGRRTPACLGFKKTSQLALEHEAAERRESQRLQRERAKRAMNKYLGKRPR
jgi:hypothetical protein